MHVLRVLDVNEAYAAVVRLLLREGRRQETRNGKAFVLDAPLTVIYEQPQRRVLFDVERDANPFFGLFEALFYLVGRNDAKWLDRFVHDFSSRFAEKDGVLHGSYGFRWRKHFDLEGGGNPNMPDQLDTVVRLLKANPSDRRAVIQMWDPVADLGQDKKDLPCNLTVVPRIVNGALNITVFNRSNDIFWGLAGANAIQFSVLQEILAGRIGVPMGLYYQISNNAHIYYSQVDKINGYPPSEGVLFYPGVQPMGTNWDAWDQDLATFMRWVDGQSPAKYQNSWFTETAEPLYTAHAMWKSGVKEAALLFLLNSKGVAPDWKAAAMAWMKRRIVRMYEKKADK